MAKRRFDDDESMRPKRLDREQLKEAVKIFSFIKPYRWSLIIGVFLLFLSSLVFMIFPYLFGQMVDIAQGNSDFEFNLRDMTFILFIILGIQGFVSYFRILLFAQVSEKGIADVRRAVYTQMISLPITFFEKNMVGELISRLTNDVEKLYAAFSITLAELMRQVIILVVGITLLFITTWKLALIMLATFPVIVIGAIFFGRQIRRLSKERQEELAKTNVILSETTQNIQVVKSFTNEHYEVKRYGQAMTDTVAIALKFARGRALFATFIVTFLFGALFFIILRAAMLVQSGDLTAGELISFVAYTAFIGGAIAGLGNFYTQLLGAIGATERIRDILGAVPELNAGKKGNTVNRFQGEVSFKKVAFRYPTRTDVPVLKEVDLKLSPGEKIALVGPSGSGKSTIIQLLLRMYAIEGGEILVDGKPIDTYDLSAYRSQFALVPQEVLLFGGTIRENILYGRPDASESDIKTAAIQSNCQEFIDIFPEGMETIVGERGVKLSGGQRQRIAIARAILKDPAILLLDEATSSLDAESEKEVQEALDKLMENRSSIIIAHRLATIREVDRIYVIDGGKIVETGTHIELVDKKEGVYASLAKLQFDTF